MSKPKQKPVSEDELLDQCIKANELCSHVTCEKSIKLIKLKCDLCRQLFCTSHVLPEIHGCGDAARKSASAPQKKNQNPRKMQELEKKMSKKLDKMRNDRKKKKI